MQFPLTVEDVLWDDNFANLLNSHFVKAVGQDVEIGLKGSMS